MLEIKELADQISSTFFIAHIPIILVVERTNKLFGGSTYQSSEFQLLSGQESTIDYQAEVTWRRRQLLNAILLYLKHRLT